MDGYEQVPLKFWNYKYPRQSAISGKERAQGTKSWHPYDFNIKITFGGVSPNVWNIYYLDTEMFKTIPSYNAFLKCLKIEEKKLVK